jgi:hypothetical protein
MTSHKINKIIEYYCFMGSTAHWMLLYMTIFTLHMFTYNSVIDSFCSKSLTWDHIGEQTYALSKIQTYKVLKI